MSLDSIADDLLRDELKDAMLLSPEEKFLDGPRLFDRACRIMADGIRADFPDASEQEVTELLARRLGLLDRLEGRP